ncbi:anhydro-N-acetylmuramic acid kinase [Eikenella sp. S3360]|uniref:Anhydro-N-acetylmuramic acid kinase n=1 Tax=Eikenella glucosivorans TaxID=2766967 RepID=A0ABS0N911_9NEIS|nr:anhydro-N-acetylmuramic acid kinase [Eikenella glucosivorans]MBH5328785.1 anhydro-N-acetylmuramic acid kinase [Eikenella glucosivorans]
MTQHYIGLMSGTSMDGVDAVLAALDGTRWQGALGHFSVPYGSDLRQRLLALQDAGANEIHRSEMLAQELARLNAQAVHGLLAQQKLAPGDIAAIGAHGQTIRHAPEHSYTVQLINLPLLAELTGIDTVGDFRRRDMAGGGQGAPLVPAFHQAVFGSPEHSRVVLNIGGIANISVLQPGTPPHGFDTGPGNMLADAYMQQHFGQDCDRNGELARTGRVIPELLHTLLEHPYFRRTPPKSTGRDLFSYGWLQGYLKPHYGPPHIVRTLNAFTAQTIADAIAAHATDAREVFACGGGVFNPVLMGEIAERLAAFGIRTADTNELALPPQWVEAAAFAWLAACRLHRQPGNPHAATGAARPYILGAWHCA